MDSSSIKSSESECKNKKEKIDNFVYPLPPKKKASNSNDDLNSRISIITNLLNIVGYDNIYLVLSNFKIELLKSGKISNEANDKIMLNNELKKKIKEEISNQFNNIKKIIFYRNYIFIISKGQINFIINIKISYNDNEILINFENIKNFQYQNTINIGSSISNIIEIIIKDVLLKNENMIKLDQKSLVEYKLYMLINSKDKFIGKSVYQKICEIQKQFQVKSEQKEKIDEYFQNHKNIIANYGSHKVYRIIKINFDKTPDNTTINFKNENGTTSTINIKDYYYRFYKISIKDKSQYLIEAEIKIKKVSNNKAYEEEKKKEILYLIPELVRIIGYCEDDESIQKKNFINPNQKMNKIKEIYNFFNSEKAKTYKNKYKEIKFKSPKEINEEWGIKLGEFLQLDARIIHQPKLIFSDNNINANQGRYRGGNPLIKKEVTDKNCFCLYFEKDRINQALFNKFKNYHKITLKNSSNWEDIEKELRSKEISKEKLLGIICLSNITENKYPKLKQFFIYNYPNIVTQFIKIDNNNFKNSLIKSLMDQINIKMGGLNFNIDLYDAKINKSNIYLIIGLTSKEQGDKTIYCMTSTTNKFLNRIKTQIKESVYENKNNVLKEMYKKSLKFFEEDNKVNPDYIIIYREGGNEYKNRTIAIDEINIFTKEIKNNRDEKNLYKDTKVYFICTNLKAELKFYQIKEKNNYSNPFSGLIVDENVIQKDKYEFYLQPHLVNQGTANPTQYQVMYYDKNEDNLNDDLTQENLEKLTFYLCFYYWTWTGAVRLPALLKMAITALNFCIKCSVVNKSLFETPIYI